MDILARSFQAQVAELNQKTRQALECFASGGLVCVADDGNRENEIDLVFHASFASTENVNIALGKAKGLLCVSMAPWHADRLGISSAPLYPNYNFGHTHFGMSLDARDGITSGISAQDRAQTIKLCAQPDSSFASFVTPGHVFPVIARAGGIMERPGHTEAVLELCALSGLPEIGAMCEVLDDLGQPLRVNACKKHPFFSEFPFISTVDILLYKILFNFNYQDYFIHNENFPVNFNREKPKKVFVSHKNINKNFMLSSHVAFFCDDEKIKPQDIRIVLTNGSYHWDNSVAKDSCAVEIVVFSQENILDDIPQDLSSYFDLSNKVGFDCVFTSVKRMLTLKMALLLVFNESNKKNIQSLENFVSSVSFVNPKDLDLLKAILLI